MILPYDACLSFNGEPQMFAECSIDGEVITHDGESDPFFHVHYIRLEGARWFRRPGYQPLGMWERIIASIVEQVEADEAFLRRALDEIEPDADAVREFWMAAE